MEELSKADSGNNTGSESGPGGVTENVSPDAPRPGIYISESPDETFELGRMIGEEVSPGSVIALNGDLGAGKTLFTQGLAEGLGVTEPVNSPTFTILQIYETGRMPLYHFDVYRIEDPYEMEEVGFDDFIYGDGVSVIEWPGQIRELLPDRYTNIDILREEDHGFDHRKIVISRMGEPGGN